MRAVDIRLHLVTDETLEPDRLDEVVDVAVAAGVTVVQLRTKLADAAEQVDTAVRLAKLIDGRAALLVNDRVDVAIAARDAGARVDGVHLGQRDISPVTARRLLGQDAIIGWTADTADHLRRLAGLPAGTVDYLGVGVIRATESKADHPPALGIGGFAAFAAATDHPCVAIGGVTAEDVEPLRQAGAAGLAVVSAICRADDPAAAARALLMAPRPVAATLSRNPIS